MVVLRNFLMIVGLVLGTFSPQGATPESRLIFPDLTQKGGFEVAQAVFNPLAEESEVTFTAYSEGGNLLAGAGINNPVTIPLGARSQLARFGREIFNLPAGEEVRGWIEATSTTAELKGFFLTLENGLERVDGADAAAQTAERFFLMLPAQLEEADSTLHVVNPQDSATQVTVSRRGADGAQVGRAEVEIPPLGKFQGPLSELALTIPAGVDPAVYLEIEADQEVAVYANFTVGTSVAGLRGLISRPGPVLYSPQLATGPVISTLLQIVNSGETPLSLRITALGDDGQPLASAIANNQLVHLAPGALLRRDGGEFFGLPLEESTSGWVEIREESGGDFEAVGSVVFGSPQAGVFTAALPLQAEGKLINLFSHVAQGEFGPINWFTGLALLNTSDRGVGATVTVRDRDGGLVASGGLNLGPGERISQLLPQILEFEGALAGGSIEVTSNGELLSFSLFGLGDLSLLAAIPTQPFESITILEDPESEGGTVRAPVIRIPPGTTLRPSGDLELVGENGVIIDGAIDTEFSVSVLSGGPIVIGGEDSPSPAGGESVASVTSQGEQGYESDTAIFLRGNLRSLNFGEKSLSNLSGGDIELVAPRVVVGCTRPPCEIRTGDGGPGVEASEPDQVISSGRGGNVRIEGQTLFVASGLKIVTGNGGTTEPVFGFPRLFGAPGGDGGTVEFDLERVLAAHSPDIITGKGGVGQSIRVVREGSSVDEEGAGGDGGRGGPVVGRIGYFATNPFPGIPGGELTGALGHGAEGGAAGATVPDGLHGPMPENGSSAKMTSGAGGRGGVVLLAAPIHHSILPGQTGQAGSIDVTGGSGGPSTNPVVPGGRGGNLDLTMGGIREQAGMEPAGSELMDPGNGNTVTIRDAINGGLGGSGCPSLMGSPGGAGGLIEITGFPSMITVTHSSNGNNGGYGNPAGAPGGSKGHLQKDVPDNRVVIDFSFLNGLPGEECPSAVTAPLDVVQLNCKFFVSQTSSFVAACEVPGPDLDVIRVGTGRRLDIKISNVPDTGPPYQIKKIEGEERMLVELPGGGTREAFVEPPTHNLEPGIYRVCIAVETKGTGSGRILEFVEIPIDINLENGDFTLEYDYQDLLELARPIQPVQVMVVADASQIDLVSPFVGNIFGALVETGPDEGGTELFVPVTSGEGQAGFIADLPFPGIFDLRLIGTSPEFPSVSRIFLQKVLDVSEFPVELSLFDLTLPRLTRVALDPRDPGGDPLTFVDIRVLDAEGVPQAPAQATLFDPFDVLLPVGKYAVTIDNGIGEDGIYRTLIREFTIDAGTPPILDLGTVEVAELPEFNDAVLLVLFDPTGKPIPQATVRIESLSVEDRLGESFRSRAETDLNGMITVQAPAGDYRISVFPPKPEM